MTFEVEVSTVWQDERGHAPEVKWRVTLYDPNSGEFVSEADHRDVGRAFRIAYQLATHQEAESAAELKEELDLVHADEGEIEEEE